MSTIWERAPEWAKRLTAIIGVITALTAFLTTIFPWDPIRLAIALSLGGLAVLLVGHTCDEIVQKVDSKLDAIEGRMIARDREQEQAICRLELLALMYHTPENVVEIEKLGRHYFQVLNGNHWMSGLFSDWCKQHGGDPSIVVK